MRWFWTKLTKSIIFSTRNIGQIIFSYLLQRRHEWTDETANWGIHQEKRKPKKLNQVFSHAHESSAQRLPMLLRLANAFYSFGPNSLLPVIRAAVPRHTVRKDRAARKQFENTYHQSSEYLWLNRMFNSSRCTAPSCTPSWNGT